VLLGGGLIVWTTATIFVLTANQPLQHDEAAFAIGTRRILSRRQRILVASDAHRHRVGAHRGRPQLD
jgi:hypothetical protein